MKSYEFTLTGGILTSINVLSNHSVMSSLVCGQYCLRYEICQGFNYKPTMLTYEDDEFNCQLSEKTNIKQDNIDDGEWVYYKIVRYTSLIRILHVLTLLPGRVKTLPKYFNIQYSSLAF